MTRVALGIVAVLVCLTMADVFVSGFSTSLTTAYLSMVSIWFISFAMGGLVAQRGFLLPAVFLASAIWVTMVAIVISIAWPVEQSVWSIITGNLSTLGLLIPTAAVGALVGVRIHVLLSKNGAAAT